MQLHAGHFWSIQDARAVDHLLTDRNEAFARRMFMTVLHPLAT